MSSSRRELPAAGLSDVAALPTFQHDLPLLFSSPLYSCFTPHLRLPWRRSLPYLNHVLSSSREHYTLNPVVYALRDCVSWMAFDVGELARCELPQMSQSQESLARRMASLSAPSRLNHLIIRLSPPLWLVEGCSTRYRLRSRVSQFLGGVKDDLPIVSEFSKQIHSFGVCTSFECPIPVARSGGLSSVCKLSEFANSVVPGACLGQFQHGTLVRKIGSGKDEELGSATGSSGTLLTHPGTDLVAACGSPIYALADGVVVDIISDSSDPDFRYLGYMVRLKHAATSTGLPLPAIQMVESESVYLHMQGPPSVQVGSVVLEHSPLGKVGRTGRLHGVAIHILR